MASVDVENRPVSFPQWQHSLAAAGLPDAQRAAFRREIMAFLHHCKVAHAPASITLARQFLATRDGSASTLARDALRWFIRSGRTPRFPAVEPEHPATHTGSAQKRGGADVGTGALRSGARQSEPLPAASDLGGADWERDLIAALRRKGLLWRTEQTYREWAHRFARFLAPRSPYAADQVDVGAFLTALAVERRASQSTQKQALNALVFLMQEGLRRQLGEIPFQRAEPGRKVPTVLDRGELTRMFAQLTGTTRLMAELAYGSGLRLLELLRLRVHHLDLPRHRLQVYDGKGAKHRITMLPALLVAPLEEQIERLKHLHASDRAAGLPGVWLPEGLTQKYARAGETFEWQWLCCVLRALNGARVGHLFASLRGQPLTQTAG